MAVAVATVDIEALLDADLDAGVVLGRALDWLRGAWGLPGPVLKLRRRALTKGEVFQIERFGAQQFTGAATLLGARLVCLFDPGLYGGCEKVYAQRCKLRIASLRKQKKKKRGKGRIAWEATQFLDADQRADARISKVSLSLSLSLLSI
jgi:hypothetical protein